MAAAKCIDPCTSKIISPSIENVVLNYKMLKPLDDALRCSICFEYYTNCMVTKCSHNYCSFCIRKYMTYKAQCPTCFQDASEPELRNNRLVDEILRLYKKLRSIDSDSPPFSPSIDEPIRTVYVQESSSFSSPAPSQCSTSKETFTPRVKIEIPDEHDSRCDKIKGRIKREPDFNEVTCPVCYNSVLADLINPHLDKCLKQQFTDDYERKKTLPKLVYHLLSDKEIKLKLKEHGLHTSGSRQTLIRRLKNFITLYNANLDALHPKPVEELIREIELQEVEEKINYLPKQIQVHKKSDQSVIDEQHQAYIKNHQHQFNALINDVHRRQISNMRIKKDPIIKNYDGSDNNEETIDEGDNSLDEDDDNIEELSKKAVKIKENIDDTDTSSSEDFEAGEISFSAERKRKKTSVSIKNQDSPKKK